MSIVFLNTLDQIEVSITEAWDKLGGDDEIVHINRPELLERSREGIGLEELTELIGNVLISTTTDDLLVCTCSSLGQAAELWGMRNDVKVIRIDRAMMYTAVRAHEVVGLVYTTDSTIKPSKKLLTEEANRAGRFVKVELIDATNAWPFITTDKEQYLSITAECVKNHKGDAEGIILAQGSTSGVVDLLTDIGLPIYSSVEIGLGSVIELVKREVV